MLAVIIGVFCFRVLLLFRNLIELLQLASNKYILLQQQDWSAYQKARVLVAAAKETGFKIFIRRTL